MVTMVCARVCGYLLHRLVLAVGVVVAIENRCIYRNWRRKNPHVVVATAVIVATKSTSCGDRKTSKLYKLSPKTTRQKVSQRQTKRLNVSKKDEKIDTYTNCTVLHQARLWLVVQFIAQQCREKKKCEIFISDPKIGFRLEVKFQFNTTQNPLITIIKSVDCRVLFCSHVFDDFFELEINFIAQKKVKHVDGS